VSLIDQLRSELHNEFLSTFAVEWKVGARAKIKDAGSQKSWRATALKAGMRCLEPAEAAFRALSRAALECRLWAVVRFVPLADIERASSIAARGLANWLVSAKSRSLRVSFAPRG
jgi:hypothetical protein